MSVYLIGIILHALLLSTAEMQAFQDFSFDK